MYKKKKRMSPFQIVSIVIVSWIVMIWSNRRIVRKKHAELAFYSYFYGSDRNASYKIRDPPSQNHDCFYFTNNRSLFQKLLSTDWIAVFDDRPTHDDMIESNMVGKHIKTCPHRFPPLSKYKYLCYLDNKITVRVDSVLKHIDRYFIQQNFAMIFPQHTFVGTNVWNEYDESMKQPRYVSEREKYKRYIRQQMHEGLQEKTQQHATCNFSLRNMKHPQTRRIGEVWYKHIQQCGIQDQISFFFVKQLFAPHICISDRVATAY